MADDAKSLLSKIPGLVDKKDAGSLVAWKDHDDKAVRKAVRKALHRLKSKGVEIPDAPAKAWSTGGTLRELRGDLEPTAQLDARSTPAVTRFLLSDPDPESGARLYAGALGPDDRVLEFAAYVQTDGQRSRLLKDWARQTEDRKVDVDWLRARIRWARDRTMASGYTVPRALDQALSSLGDAPEGRPAPFVADALQDEATFDPKDADALLNTLGVPRWPPMVNLDGTLQKAATIHGDKPQPTEEKDRLELLALSCAGDEDARKGLKGALANALEDVAIHAWLEGNNSAARGGLDMAKQLRESDEPETNEWAARLLGYQVASLLRAMGGPEAVRRAQEQMAAEKDTPA
jgi:hypothetical protein